MTSNFRNFFDTLKGQPQGLAFFYSGGKIRPYGTFCDKAAISLPPIPPTFLTIPAPIAII